MYVKDGRPNFIYEKLKTTNSNLVEVIISPNNDLMNVFLKIFTTLLIHQKHIGQYSSMARKVLVIPPNNSQ